MDEHYRYGFLTIYIQSVFCPLILCLSVVLTLKDQLWDWPSLGLCAQVILLG